ncbi:hypothetical protein [Flavobacterium mesophilum]|uniref:hypothetical protein n=1 Tax=Flavobacterium mesophilum TaxID=3143495 RepID=UPI0031DE308D
MTTILTVSLISAQNNTQEDEKRRQEKWEKIAKIKRQEEKEEAQKLRQESKLKPKPVTHETKPDSLAYWNQLDILSFSKSEKGLREWLSTPHPEYNMASWCFYGNITTDDGEVVAISSMIQQQLNMGGMPYLAEFSYCDRNGYKVVPFEVEANDVQFKAPFSVKVTYKYICDMYLEITLLSGEMGQAGAKYRLAGNVIDLKGNNLKYDLILTDTYGAIQIGYGTTSFLPQWLTPSQHQNVMANYKGSVPNYLNARKDTMLGQGSYYYSMPLLKVESFLLYRKVDNEWKQYANGKKGNIWVDYVVQGFNSQEKTLLKNAQWQFLAIQFPEKNASLMVSIVDVPPIENISSKVLPMARLYYGDKKATNGSKQAYYEWAIDQIEYKPTKYWVDPKTGLKYPIEFDLNLRSPDDSYLKLKGKSVRDNQVVGYGVNKYEGVFSVEADIQVKDLNATNLQGFSWAEIH